MRRADLGYVLLACSLLGLCGCFLPLGGSDLSFWNVRYLAPAKSIVTVLAFASAVMVSVTPFIRPPFERWHAAVCCGAFAFVLLSLYDAALVFLTEGAIGAKLMIVTALVGLPVALFAVLRPLPGATS